MFYILHVEEEEGPDCSMEKADPGTEAGIEAGPEASDPALARSEASDPAVAGTEVAGHCHHPSAQGLHSGIETCCCSCCCNVGCSSCTE